MKNVKRKSAIATALGSLLTWIYTMASGGFFGKIFTSYSKVNARFKSSAAVALVGNGSRVASFVRRIRFKIAALFEQSAFLYLWNKIVLFLIGCRMRFYGCFTLVFGIYTGLIYLVKRYAFSVSYADPIYLVAAAVLILLALPMLASRKTLAAILLESRAGHFIVSDLFGIADEKLEVEPSRHGDVYNIAIISGLVFGSLTYFINPVELILTVVTLAVIALVLSNPEIGIVLTAIMLPFFKYLNENGEAMYFLVALYSLGYFLKLLRGKRILRVDIYDLLMLIFGVVLLLGGFVSVGGESSATRALSMFLLLVGAFVALNLLRTAGWIKRCAAALFSSAFFVSVVMLWQFVAERAQIGLDLKLFAAGTNPFFEGREALSAYLLAAFGITLSLLSSFKRAKSKFTAWLGSLCIFGAILTIGCKSAIVGAIAAVIVYFVITKRKTITVLFFSAAAAVYAAFMLPSRFVGGLIAFFESLLFYFWRAVSVWRGAFGIIVASLFGGIGVDAFALVYPRFSLAGSEKASETSSLMLRILCDVGAVGLIVFAIVLILFSQNCFEYIKNTKNRSRLTVAGGFCAVIGLLCQSMFFDVWSDMTVFYVFWLVMAMTVARIRVGDSEAERKKLVTVQSDNRASVDLY